MAGLLLQLRNLRSKEGKVTLQRPQQPVPESGGNLDPGPAREKRAGGALALQLSWQNARLACPGSRTCPQNCMTGHSVPCCVPAPSQQREEGQKVKVILSYTASLGPAWETQIGGGVLVRSSEESRG